MDKKLISTWQRHEVDHIVSAYKIPREVVKDVIWNAGRSRPVIYRILMRMGYNVPDLPLKWHYQKKKVDDLIVRMGL